MGVKLIREVLDHAPDTLTAADRLLLVVIAETASDATREGWPGWELIARRMRWHHQRDGGKNAVSTALAAMARRGVDVRVPIARGKDGRPVYAAAGRRTIYRIPPFERVEESATQTSPKGGMECHPERVADRPTQGGNPGGVKGGNPRGKRVALHATPSTQEPSENRQQYARARVNDPDDDAAILAEIRRQRPDASPALIRHIAREDGPTILAELRARQERERIAAAIADARRGPVCRHGTPGGEALHPVSGEPLCPMCRRHRRLVSLPTATPA